MSWREYVKVRWESSKSRKRVDELSWLDLSQSNLNDG